MIRRAAPLVVATAAALAACGGGGDETRTLEIDVADTEGGLVDIQGVECRRDGDQLIASGVARNRGDTPHHISISVRFVDGDDVRVDLTTDSISDLTTAESARWDVNLYASAADSVVRCEVSAIAS